MAWLVAHKTRRGATVFYVCWRDAAGRHRSHPTRTSDRRVADMHRRRVEVTEEGRVLAPKEETPTPQAMLDAYLAHVALAKTEETATAYRQFLAPMVREWAAVPVESWNRQMTEAYARERRNRRRRPWSGRSAGIWLSGCRGWVAYAARLGLPLPDFVDGFRAWRHQRPTISFLDGAQLVALLRAARGHAIEPIIALAGFAGLRLKEARSATVGDIDWHRGVLTVHGTKGHADRLLPIVAPLAEVLKRVAPTGGKVVGQMSHSFRYYHLWRLCKVAGVPRISWHGLRHSYATALLDAGATLPEVQLALGHKNLSSTGVYLHARIDGLAAAARRAFD